MTSKGWTPEVFLAGATLAGFLALIAAFIFHPVEMDDKEAAIVGGMAVVLGSRLKQAFDAVWPGVRSGLQTRRSDSKGEDAPENLQSGPERSPVAVGQQESARAGPSEMR